MKSPIPELMDYVEEEIRGERISEQRWKNLVQAIRILDQRTMELAAAQRRKVGKVKKR